MEHDASPIIQIDGNDSLDMADLSDSAPTCGNQDFAYNYALNPQNQARRLVSQVLLKLILSLSPATTSKQLIVSITLIM